MSTYLKLTLLLLFTFVTPLAVGRQAGREPYLSRPIGSGEAFIWYLHNSGWAIKTKNHLLIFDYIGEGHPAPVKTLAGGLVNTDEIKHQRVVVFVTHEHGDHYSDQIFEWEKSVRDITYVFGWPVAKEGTYIKLSPGERRNVGALEVQTIKSTDQGVGFLVRVDGLTIFHAGDHARWDARSQALYEQEIDRIAQGAASLDLAFIPIATGLRCQPTESIAEGAYYAIEKLKPKAVFPMHIRCPDKLHLYREFAETGAKKKAGAKIYFAEKPGDGFRYHSFSVRKLGTE